MISKAFFLVALKNSLAVNIRRPASFENCVSISLLSNVTLYLTPSIIIVMNSWNSRHSVGVVSIGSYSFLSSLPHSSLVCPRYLDSKVQSIRTVVSIRISAGASGMPAVLCIELRFSLKAWSCCYYYGRFRGWRNCSEQTQHCCEPRTGFWVGWLLSIDSKRSEGLSASGFQESRLEGSSLGMPTNLLAANINSGVWAPDLSFPCYLCGGSHFPNETYIKLSTPEELKWLCATYLGVGGIRFKSLQSLVSKPAGPGWNIIYTSIYPSCTFLADLSHSSRERGWFTATIGIRK